MKNKISILVAIFLTSIAYSQCPTITVPSSFTLTNCQGGNTISATSNYSANISSRWIGPGNIPIASLGTATSVVYLNAAEIYTVEFTDNSSNCIVTETVAVWDVFQKPSFNLSAGNFSLLCTSSQITVNFINGSTFPIPGGPISYTFICPACSTVFPNNVLSTQSTYTIATCGIYEAIIRDNANLCDASYRFSIACSTLNPTPLLVSGNTTVCSGSSVTYTSTGTNHLWNTGATSSTINVIPATNVAYSVSGNDINGCPSTGSVAVTVNTTCTDVWPGDANSDGIVDNVDVFEIGLAMSSTGPARSPGGNAYTSQFANNWTGTISTGKNRSHADCDGNGLIDLNDTLAIFTNFLLPHAFKSTLSAGNNPDLSISANPVVSRGAWNKATISLGDNTNSISQILGLAFTLNYDASMIETDSLYLTYLPSFLNSNGQNVQFRKKFFGNGKMYGTSVRANGTNVNGNGAIAELYFKVKSGIAENSVINFSLSDVQKINSSGNKTLLSSGNLSVLVDANAVGLSKENAIEINVSFFPNPTVNEVTLVSNSNTQVAYKIFAISGKEVLEGQFKSSVKIDLTAVVSGSYFVEFEQHGIKAYKKLIIAR
ncbi:hypothetical protein CNR22_12440 [Sphingobacteriaceae bacterium]|nr:hypothetical protein CNR22_12440 [Sphingobacteriaceae bacterium]